MTQTDSPTFVPDDNATARAWALSQPSGAFPLEYATALAVTLATLPTNNA